MRAIPMSTRERILADLDQGQRQADVACAHRVSLSSVERLARMRREGRSLVPRKQGRPPIVPAEQHALFLKFFDTSTAVCVTPSYRELARRWHVLTGVCLKPATLLKLCERMGLYKPREWPAPIVAARWERYFRDVA
ncbi:hypothetical protein DAETH_33260 (plasmid) [Deinococcus aetherius]|uniref:Transposase n=1 Tax=Deinococcus aetherius TaxID=200252 RepID=A0ABN6RP00_9DEIO|nr:hypothetical protein DAETH_33260 [Deinococcus aetherius]